MFDNKILLFHIFVITLNHSASRSKRSVSCKHVNYVAKSLEEKQTHLFPRSDFF